MLLASFDGSTMTGLLPLSREPRLRRLPVPGMVTGRGDYGFFGVPLTLPGRASEVVESMLAALVAARVPWLQLDLLPAEAEFVTSLLQFANSARLPLKILAETERAVAHAAAPTPALSNGSRARFARKRRSLTRDLGVAVETVDRSADPAAVDDFLRLEASGWKGRIGGAFQVRPGHAEFLRHMWDGFREQGRLDILSLQAGDRSLAMRCCLRGSDVLYGFKTSFDDELRRYSPGTLLELELFGRLGGRIEMIDACAAPDNDWLNGIYPARRPMRKVLVGLSTAGRAAMSSLPLYDSAAALRERVRARTRA